MAEALYRTIDELLSDGADNLEKGEVFSFQGVIVQDKIDDEFMDSDGEFGALESSYTAVYKTVDDAKSELPDDLEDRDLAYISFNLTLGGITVTDQITGADVVNNAIDSVGKAGE